MDREEFLNTAILAVYSFLITFLALLREFGVLLVVLFASLIVYALLQRQINNMIKTIIPKQKRSYVVVYFRKMATKIPLVYYVVPDEKTGFDVIEKGSYDLHKDGALPNIPNFKHRLHFLIDEGNSIPVKADIRESDDVILKDDHGLKFVKTIWLNEKPTEVECPECHKHVVLNKPVIRTWAFRVKSALTTVAYDFIYGEKRQWAFIIALVAAAIAVVVAIYAISEIQQIKPLVNVIYQRTIVGNETTVIRQR